MRRIIPGVLLLLTACASGARVEPEAAGPAPTGEISASELRRDLFAFAADSMRGRETGTPDANRAAEFLADRIQRLGLEPAGDSMFLQRIPLQRERFTADSWVRVTIGGTTTALTLGTDVVPLVNLGPGVPPPRREADGDLVFVGYGLTTGTPARDDFAGLSLAGKVVVVVNGAPAGADSSTRASARGTSSGE